MVLIQYTVNFMTEICVLDKLLVWLAWTKSLAGLCGFSLWPVIMCDNFICRTAATKIFISAYEVNNDDML